LLAPPVAEDVLLWLAPLPCPAAFTGDGVAVAEDVAVWSVDAFWTVDWDWPALEPPPCCVWVLLWLVELSLTAEDDEVFELT
jgi:hypothetical protein